MKRYWLFLLAISLAIAFPRVGWADVSLVKTADGTEFKFGLRNKFQPFTLAGLDLLKDANFRSFISPDTALGDQSWGIHNFANLTFTLERGPLRIHANLEMETAIDANSVDQNNINLERMALYYKIPDLGTLAVGFDVHAFDPEGGLIYTDEHPGIWLVGGDDSLSWDVGWHHVRNCMHGSSLFTNNLACSALGGGSINSLGGVSAQALNDDQVYDLFFGRANVGLDGWVISPLFMWSRRHVPQVDINEFSDPTGTAGAFATTDRNSYSDQFRPGMVVKGDLGPVTLTGQAVGLLGKINDVGSGFLGGAPTAADPVVPGLQTKDDYDLRSFAMFFEAALDGDEIGMPGFTPYFNFEWQSGDGNPFNDTYSGYVPISNLSAALRKDGFKGQSISSFGPATLGANSQDGWGFDVTARGVGPTLGTIVPDETLGSVGGDATHFNNRGGKGGNPGFLKVAGGILGKFAENWDTHVGFDVMWFHKSEAIEAEASQNCIARGSFTSSTFGACAGGDPTSSTDVAEHVITLRENGIDLEGKYIGFQLNANIGYTVNAFRVQPYFSVFVPGDIVRNIGRAFLDSTTPTRDDETAFTAGVELSAAF